MLSVGHEHRVLQDRHHVEQPEEQVRDIDVARAAGAHRSLDRGAHLGDLGVGEL